MIYVSEDFNAMDHARMPPLSRSQRAISSTANLYLDLEQLTHRLEVPMTAHSSVSYSRTIAVARFLADATISPCAIVPVGISNDVWYVKEDDGNLMVVLLAIVLNPLRPRTRG